MASSTAKSALAQKASGSVAKKEDTGMKALLTKMAGEIKAALPENMKSERFQRVVLTAFSSNKALQKCDPVSFLAAMMESAQLGLEPNTPLGQAYLIPYGNKVQFQVGYKGLMELAQRSGKFKTIYAHTVYENDTFEVEYGLAQNIIHKPNFEDRGAPIGYYAVYKLTNGGESFVFMTKKEVEDHGKAKSKTFYNGPWKTDFNAMALKTVLKQLLKYAPMSIELQKAAASDMAVKSEISDDMSLVENEVDLDFVEAEYEEKIEDPVDEEAEEVFPGA